MNMMNTSLDPRLFDPRIERAFLEGINEAQYYASIIDQKEHMQVSPNDPQAVRSMNFVGLGQTQLKGETDPFPYDTMNRGYELITTHNEYGLAVAFSRKLRDDDRTDIVIEGAKQVGRTPNLLYNYETAKVYNNAFNSTYFEAPDTLPLLSEAHTSTVNGLTRANMLNPSAPLTYESLQELLVVGMRQTNMRGDPEPAFKPGDTIQLVVQPNNYFEATKLLDSHAMYEPTSNKNAPNVLKKFNWTITTNPFLTGTGAGNYRYWFIMPQSGSIGVEMVHRIKPENSQHQDPDTDARVFKVYLRFHNRITMWEKVYGSGN